MKRKIRRINLRKGLALALVLNLGATGALASTQANPEGRVSWWGSFTNWVNQNVATPDNVFSGLMSAAQKGLTVIADAAEIGAEGVGATLGAAFTLVTNPTPTGGGSGPNNEDAVMQAIINADNAQVITVYGGNADPVPTVATPLNVPLTLNNYDMVDSGGGGGGGAYSGPNIPPPGGGDDEMDDL